LIGYLDSENQNVQLEICIVCSETGSKKKKKRRIMRKIDSNEFKSKNITEIFLVW